ncbi:hypothetical protein [Dactylosporangium sp. NPDC005555]|uniref:hypothetical protein n=1 Tax=Dactylosporangium sp. NPDC005555 TaxID=3154889 RepID=UPI0033BD7C1C
MRWPRHILTACLAFAGALVPLGPASAAPCTVNEYDTTNNRTSITFDVRYLA